MNRSDIVEKICERLANGEALAAVCRSKDMPTTRTFLRWADEDVSIAGAYGKALEARAEWFLAEHDRIRQTAVSRETAAAARVQLSALEWQISKMAPKRYGDSTTVRHADPDGNKLRAMDDTARAIRIASIFNAARLNGPDAETD